MQIRRMASIFILSILMAFTPGSSSVADTTLTVGRFFGPCTDPNTSLDRAHGEACISQAILNAFSMADNGIKVEMRPADWDRYYEELRASYNAGTPPDLHILHRHRLPDFVSTRLLASLGDDLVNAGIDPFDWHPHAKDAVTIDEQIFGLPIDMHANLWHINLAILAEADLIQDDGRPLLPTSPGEMLDHAAKVKQATGKDYLASDFIEFPIGVRAVLTLLWQQEKNVYDSSGVTIDTPEMRAAMTTITDLFDAGYADPTYDYELAQQAFLNNEAAILINGTWAVELYDREASKAEVPLNDYDVADFPTLFDRPATWADSHLWVVPADLKGREPERYQAALKLLRWINDHNLEWARTGHLAVRQSVLNGDDYAKLPHRPDYMRSAQFIQDIPRSEAYRLVQGALTSNLQAVWQGRKSLSQALADAEINVASQLNTN